MTSEERIAELEAENAKLREQLAVVLAHVQELEARLAKDSHNSASIMKRNRAGDYPLMALPARGSPQHGAGSTRRLSPYPLHS